MRDLLKKAMRRSDTLTLGGKTVQLQKITPAKWRQLFNAIGIMPQLIINLANAPKEDLPAYLLSATEIGMDEFLRCVEALTGIEAEYLEENAGLDELVEYVCRMYEMNNIDRTIKNVLGLLPKMPSE